MQFLSRQIFLLLLLALPVLAFCQPAIEFHNKVYDKNIKAVKLHLDGLPLSQPILDLRSSGKLLLTFDDISPYEVEYYYTIVHCTSDWEQSPIEPIQYLKFYEEGEIDNYFFSGATEVPYSHYRLRIPNQEVAWTVSGNYIIIVYYYDGSTKVPVLTRRFMVNEDLVGISANFRYPIKTEHLRTHQEMAIKVNTYEERFRAPETQLRLYVYQNGRWDVSKKDQRYDRYIGNVFQYDLPGKYSFPANKEFRHLNNRYINSPSGDFMSLERDAEGYFAVRYPESSRLYDNYLTYIDINGQYIIQNKEEPLRQREVIEYGAERVGDSLVGTQTITQERYIQDTLCLRCEYVRVQFTLNVVEKLDQDVYLFGAFTGWRLDPTYKMEYDPYRKAYFADVLLKQGYYDYFYAVEGEDGEIDTYTLEGNWHETENDYLILIYDKHPFNLFDRLIGASVVNSSQ